MVAIFKQASYRDFRENFRKVEIVMKVEELIDLIARALEVELDTVSIDSSNETIDAWDSLGHISIMLQLENNLGEQIEKISELTEAYSVRDIHTILTRNGF